MFTFQKDYCHQYNQVGCHKTDSMQKTEHNNYMRFRQTYISFFLHFQLACCQFPNIFCPPLFKTFCFSNVIRCHIQNRMPLHRYTQSTYSLHWLVVGIRNQPLGILLSLCVGFGWFVMGTVWSGGSVLLPIWGYNQLFFLLLCSQLHEACIMLHLQHASRFVDAFIFFLHSCIRLITLYGHSGCNAQNCAICGHAPRQQLTNWRHRVPSAKGTWNKLALVLLPLWCFCSCYYYDVAKIVGI